MSELELLKESEYILSFSYWENFKWHKDAAQSLGANHPKVKRIGESVEVIRQEWISVQLKIKEFEKSR